MKIYQMTCSQPLPISPDVAWAFFSNPANLHQLMPDWMPMQDESMEHPKVCYPGLLQIYTVKIMGLIPTRWVAEITHVEPLKRFVDEQKKGPFAFWHHTHEIIPVKDGVIIKDSLAYAIPFGIFGRIAHALFVGRQVEAIFAHRWKMLEEFFG